MLVEELEPLSQCWEDGVWSVSEPGRMHVLGRGRWQPPGEAGGLVWGGQTDRHLEIDAVQKSARPMCVVMAGGAGVPVSWGVWECGDDCR